MWLAPWSAEAALPRAVAAQSGWIRWCGSAQLSCLRWMVTCSLCGQWVGGTSPTNPAGSMNRKRSLRFAGLHPRTLRAYRQALDRFLKFVKKRTRLAEFIDLSYQEGEPLSYAGHLLSAMKRFHPELRLELPRSSQYFRNWQRCYTPPRGLFQPHGTWCRHLWGWPSITRSPCSPSSLYWASTACYALRRCWILPTNMWWCTPGTMGSASFFLRVRLLKAILRSCWSLTLSWCAWWNVGCNPSLRRCSGPKGCTCFGRPFRCFGLFSVRLHPLLSPQGGGTWHFQATLSLDGTVYQNGTGLHRWRHGTTGPCFLVACSKEEGGQVDSLLVKSAASPGKKNWRFMRLRKFFGGWKTRLLNLKSPPPIEAKWWQTRPFTSRGCEGSWPLLGPGLE